MRWGDSKKLLKSDLLGKLLKLHSDSFGIFTKSNLYEKFLIVYKKVASSLFAVILCTNLTNSQTIVESLREGSLPSNLEIIGPGANAVIFSSSGVTFNGAGMIGNAEGRAFIRTKGSNYLSNSFVAEISMNFDPTKPNISWFGVGGNSLDQVYYYEPDGPCLQIAPHTASGGELDGRISYNDKNSLGVGDGGIFFNVTSTNYKMRITWDAVSGYAIFEVDSNYLGGLFVADATRSLFGLDNGFNEFNSRLFFGGSDGVSFKDFSIVPEPSALSLLAVGLGVLFRRSRKKD